MTSMRSRNAGWMVSRTFAVTMNITFERSYGRPREGSGRAGGGPGGVGAVRRDDDHHVREVVRHAEVVIAEGEVLLRVEHLEQRRGGIAAVVRTDVVDLVARAPRVVAV